MNPQIVQQHKRESTLAEAILFVRTEYIAQAMVRVPLLVVGLIAVAIAMPIQNSVGLTRSLDLIIYQDGSTHVTTQFEIDTQQPDYQVQLFGSAVDNFVATGDGGFLLQSQITDNTANIETLGVSSVSVEYDIHDLVSKTGRVWSFEIDAPSDYSLLLPQNAVIVGMSSLPSSMEVTQDRSRLLLPEGPTRVDYIFGAAPVVLPDPPVIPPTQNPNDYSLIVVIIGVAIAAAAITLYTKSKKRITVPSESVLAKPQLSPDVIFEKIPDLRDDDKELVSFIFESGGQVKESDLRKKFLQPRTTMWRAVKRLERNGIVEIHKQDQQNLVKLKDHIGEDQQ